MAAKLLTFPWSATKEDYLHNGRCEPLTHPNDRYAAHGNYEFADGQFMKIYLRGSPKYLYLNMVSPCCGRIVYPVSGATTSQCGQCPNVFPKRYKNSYGYSMGHEDAMDEIIVQLQDWLEFYDMDPLAAMLTAHSHAVELWQEAKAFAQAATAGLAS